MAIWGSSRRHRRVGLGVAIHALRQLCRWLAIDASSMLIVTRGSDRGWGVRLWSVVYRRIWTTHMGSCHQIRSLCGTNNVSMCES